MSVFRPAARLTSPDGRDWELYAYRIRLPRRARGDAGFDSDLPDVRVQVLSGLLDGALWLVGGLLRLVARVLWGVPRAGDPALVSDDLTSEAITCLRRGSSQSEMRASVLSVMLF